MKIAETVTFAGDPWGEFVSEGRPAVGFDRTAALRTDAEGLAALARRPLASMILLRNGEPLVEGSPESPRLARVAFEGLPGNAVFLGLEAGEGLWAVAVESDDDAGSGRDWADLRGVMARLPARDAGIAATARAILGWHAIHGFCAVCGVASVATQGGWRRDCPACNATHFPRTDPVVIALVTRGNSVLLGRSPGWPEGMYSLLAGFIEPGETMEAAVRREVMEETGVRVGRVGYLASQPWPFPASLMLGCRAEALSEEITIDPIEIEAALWVPRERMARIWAGADTEIRAPRDGPIAGFILRNWLADRLD